MAIILRSDCCPPCTKPSPCDSCCPAQSVYVSDRRNSPTQQDGTFYSGEFPAWCFKAKTPHCKVIKGYIDDFGRIGGVWFDTHKDCSPGYSGETTKLTPNTEVKCAKDGTTNRLKVDWTAYSSNCKGRTGLDYCTFYFWWT